MMTDHASTPVPSDDDACRVRRRDLLWIALVALALSAAGFLDIGLNNPDYLRDSRHNGNPDALHYVLLGRNVWEHGVYSRQDGPSYTPDMLRSPVYPLIAGGLDLLFGAWGVYAFQALCRTATALLVYCFCCPLFGRKVARTAAFLLAADVMLAVLDFETMAEPLFNLLAATAVLLWLHDLFHPAQPRPRCVRALLCGLLLGLATLTRPTGLYLIGVLAAVEGILAWKRRSLPVLKHAVVIVAGAALLVVPWIVRNHQIFGIARLTTADALTLIYDAGAGAYSVEHELSTEEARAMVAREFGIVPYVLGNNHWQADRTVKEMDDEYKAVQFRVLGRYPRALAASTVGGLSRAALSHNVDTYASVTGRTWNPPGMGKLLRGQVGEFLRQLFDNSPLLVVLFLSEVTFAVLVLGAGLLGLVYGLRRRDWRGPVVCLALVVGYYGLTVAAVGLPAYARYRAMLVPLFCILAAFSISRLWGAEPARRLHEDLLKPGA